MIAIQLPEPTYHLLRQRALEEARTPDDLANDVLRRALAPTHPHIEIVTQSGGPTAVIRGTRVPVSILVGYAKMGETPQSIVERVLPHLTLAQVHDALSYYYDHQFEVDRERADNTEDAARIRLRERLGEEGYLQITGQKA